MEEVIPGIEYTLKNFNTETHQTVRFVSKDSSGFVDGTTNEEVVNMLIDRYYNLQKKAFSVENQVVIEHLKGARRAMAKRLTKKVHRLKAKGKHEHFSG